MISSARVITTLALAALVTAEPARAEPAPLAELPADKLAQMEPLLRHGEIALLEATPEGREKQVTVIALAKASPQTVREVLMTPEKWPDFVPHLEHGKIERRADGSLVYDFELDAKILTLHDRKIMVPRADGAVDIRDPDPTDRSTQRWQLFGVPGGTIIVQYGYTHVLHAGGIIKRLVSRAPMLEHGLALAGQLAFVRAFKARAERIARPGTFPPMDPSARGPGFGFLLSRGRVAVIRSQTNGRLADISILENVYAPLERVAQAIEKIDDYARFIEGVKKCIAVRRGGGETQFDMDFDLSVIGFSTRYAMRRVADAIDVLGLSGDLRGSHVRWDLTAKGPKETLAVYRANVDLAAGSPLVLGLVYRAQPLFEHGIAVAHGLVNVVGVRGRAEGWR